MVTQIADNGAQTRRVGRRAERFAAQRWLWSRSSLPRVACCGLHTTGGDVSLRVAAAPDGQRHGGFSGLQSCGSVWSCPTCSAKVLGRRQSEVQAMVQAGARLGLRPALVTSTVRHGLHDSLPDVWDGIQAGHEAVFSGRAGDALRDRWGVPTGEVRVCAAKCCGARVVCRVKSCGADSARGRRHALVCKGGQLTKAAARHAGFCVAGRPVGLLPWVRVVETKLGGNGWHVHQHMLVLLRPDADLWEFYGEVFGSWQSGVRAAGLDAVSVNVPIWADSSAAVAEYVSKGGGLDAARLAGFEIARGDLKVGRLQESVTPGEILAAAAGGDESAAARWAEWEAGSAGRRQMTWAGGVRDLLGLGAEVSDADIAAEEVGTVADSVAVVPRAAFASCVAWVPGRRALLLDAVERETGEALALLDDWGVPWRAPTEDDRGADDLRTHLRHLERVQRGRALAATAAVETLILERRAATRHVDTVP